MQSGSIYGEQLDADLFAVNTGHVMRSRYWSHVSVCNSLRCHTQTLVIVEVHTLRSCCHLSALYQDANE